MTYQAFFGRGSRLKRSGVGLVGAVVLVAVTGCSASLALAPMVAPAPTAAPAANRLATVADIPTTRAYGLEVFRYADRSPRATLPVATDRPLEFFRYTAISDPTTPPSGSAQPLEMFRYRSGTRATTTAQGARHPLEFFRTTCVPPAAASPAS